MDADLTTKIKRAIELYGIMDKREPTPLEKDEYEILKGDADVQTALDEYIENDALSPFGLDVEELKIQVKKMKLAAVYDIEIEIVKGSWSPLSANSTWKNGQIILHAENADFRNPVMDLVEGDAGSYSEHKAIGDFSFRPTTTSFGRFLRPKERLLRIEWPNPDPTQPTQPTQNKIIFFRTEQVKEDFKKKHSDWEYIKGLMNMDDQQLRGVVDGWGITSDQMDAASTVAKSMTRELTSDDREPVAVMILHKKNTGEEAAAESWLNEIIAAPRAYAVAHGGNTFGAALRAGGRGGGKKKKKKSKKRSKKRRNTKRIKSKKSKSKKRKSKTRRKRR
jgi:hypothetical protein